MMAMFWDYQVMCSPDLWLLVLTTIVIIIYLCSAGCLISWLEVVEDCQSWILILVLCGQQFIVVAYSYFQLSLPCTLMMPRKAQIRTLTWLRFVISWQDPQHCLPCPCVDLSSMGNISKNNCKESIPPLLNQFLHADPPQLICVFSSVAKIKTSLSHIPLK